MNKTTNILLGWALSASVVLATLIGLPVLAKATGEVRQNTSWQKLAERVNDIGQEYYSDYGLARKLSDAYLPIKTNNTKTKSPYLLDHDMTADLYGLDGDLLAKVKDQARQIDCLAEAIYYEARSESTNGQKAVAEVVLNRVKSKHFPDTICEVVYQGAERVSGCQFSFACDGSTAKLPFGRHWQKAQKIAEHMLIYKKHDLTNGATHYHTTNVNPRWAKHLRYLRQYDTHVFYRFMPRKRQIRPKTSQESSPVSVAP